jgi:galactose mutarotase-like enzyme
MPLHLASILAFSANVGQVHIGKGRGELPVATLTHPSGATAEVYLHGAHVTSWRPADGVERLFVSSASRYAAGKAIRGGIPVCFPQFSGRGPLPNHGFARTSSGWQVESTSSDGPGGEVCLVLSLSDSDESRAVWPHAFELRYTVTLRDASLSTDVQLRNAGGEPLEFTAALHTYLATHAETCRESAPFWRCHDALPGPSCGGLPHAPGRPTRSARAAVPPQPRDATAAEPPQGCTGVPQGWLGVGVGLPKAG